MSWDRGGEKISYIHSLPSFIIFEVQKRIWLADFSGYFTVNCTADAACDEEDKTEYCWCCLFFLQPEMELFSLFFCEQHFIQKNVAVAELWRNGICFLVIAHHMVFRGRNKQALKRWKHDCLFWQYEGCCCDVLPVLIVLVWLY